MKDKQIFHRILVVVAFIFVIGFNIKTLSGNNTTASLVSNKSVTSVTENNFNDDSTQDGFDFGFYYGQNNQNRTDYLSSLNTKITMEALNVSVYENSSVFPNDYSFFSSNKLVPVIFLDFKNITNSRNDKGFFDSILDGEFDGGLKDLAEKLSKKTSTNKTQIVIVPFYEFNSNQYTWNISGYRNSPEKFILAYRHVGNILKTNQNIKFAWTINSISSPNNNEIPLNLSYPGNDYVDIVSVDGFNTGDPWRTFDEIFSSPVSMLRQFGKPVYILSTNSIDTESDSQSKKVWISDMFLSDLIKNFEIKGLIWDDIE